MQRRKKKYVYNATFSSHSSKRRLFVGRQQQRKEVNLIVKQKTLRTIQLCWFAVTIPIKVRSLAVRNAHINIIFISVLILCYHSILILCVSMSFHPKIYYFPTSSRPCHFIPQPI